MEKQTEIIQETEIKISKDYDSFKFIKGNRAIIDEHVSQLTKKIEENDLTSVKPIIVNEKMEIIDGQHTFLACKKLNKPIYYCLKLGLNSNDIIPLNTNVKNWSLEQFLNHFVQTGIESYKILNKFINLYGYTITQSIILLKGSMSSNNSNFKTGKLLVNDGDFFKACKIADKLNFLRGKPYYEKTSPKLIRAFVKLINLKNYKHNLFVDHCKKKNNLLIYKESVEEYFDLFLKIYNFGLSKKISE